MKVAQAIILMASTVLYTVIGGVIIHFLEYDYQKTTRTEISRRLDRTVQQFLCMSVIRYFTLLVNCCIWRGGRRYLCFTCWLCWMAFVKESEQLWDVGASFLAAWMIGKVSNRLAWPLQLGYHVLQEAYRDIFSGL